MSARIYHMSDKVRTKSALIRRLVSKKKKRYQYDGVNLDLTYITESIIAMGFPSTGTESFYRNPQEEVFKFLHSKHGKYYRVYNLCIEPDR